MPRETKTVVLDPLQLRSLIREVHEGESHLPGAEAALREALDEYVTTLDEAWGYDVDLGVLRDEVISFVEGYFRTLR